MPVAVTCSSCTTRLQIPEHGLGKRVKCPKCASVFVAEDADAPVEAFLDEQIAEKPISVPKQRVAVGDAPAPAAKRKRGQEQAAEEEDFETAEEVAEEETEDGEEERPRKKKRKKRKRRRVRVADDRDEYESPAWPWWVFGGGGIAAVMLFFLMLAIVAEPLPVKWVAIYMLIMMPISTVIFFMAMILSSVLVGAMEIGEIHIALVKAFGLVLVVNLISVMPCVGIYMTLLVWVIGVVIVFRLDFWEARVLVFFNWLLNFAANMALFYAVNAWLAQGGSMIDDDDFGPPPNNRPGIQAPAPGQGPPGFGGQNNDDDD